MNAMRPALGYVHTDTSTSPSFGSRLVEASPARVEHSRSLVQANNSTLSIDNLQWNWIEQVSKNLPWKPGPTKINYEKVQELPNKNKKLENNSSCTECLNKVVCPRPKDNNKYANHLLIFWCQIYIFYFLPSAESITTVNNKLSM